MDAESYALVPDASRERFYFESVGPRGRILKIVEFTEIDPENDVWNLGFGDFNPAEGDWSDSTNSNNGDIVRVMASVVRAAVRFTDGHPNRALVLRPFDEKRRVFYQAILERKKAEISQFFQIFGYNSGQKVRFIFGGVYDAHFLIRKPN